MHHHKILLFWLLKMSSAGARAVALWGTHASMYEVLGSSPDPSPSEVAVLLGHCMLFQRQTHKCLSMTSLHISYSCITCRTNKHSIQMQLNLPIALYYLFFLPNYLRLIIKNLIIFLAHHNLSSLSSLNILLVYLGERLHSVTLRT